MPYEDDTAASHGVEVVTGDLNAQELAAEIQRLEGVIEAVELLHHEGTTLFLHDGLPTSTCTSCHQVWPCATIKAIDEARS